MRLSIKVKQADKKKKKKAILNSLFLLSLFELLFT